MWTRAEDQTGVRYRRIGSEFFIDRPKNAAHQQAIGMPERYRYAIYKRGDGPRGCAGLWMLTRTLSDAKHAVEYWDQS